MFILQILSNSEQHSPEMWSEISVFLPLDWLLVHLLYFCNPTNKCAHSVSFLCQMFLSKMTQEQEIFWYFFQSSSCCVSIIHSLYFCTEYYFLDVQLFYCFYSRRVCVSVCEIVSGVFHYRAPRGRNPPLVFRRGRCCHFGVKNNNRIRGCASCLLRFNCTRVLVPGWVTASRGRHACRTGMCNEWRSPSGLKEAVCGVCLRAPNEDGFAGLHCSINRGDNKRGREPSRRWLVSGDWVSAMLSLNPCHISQMPLLLSLLSCVI